ncbi:MAG: hypothetical protein ACYC8T_38805 [Myxococcaceae bacterium]
MPLLAALAAALVLQAPAPFPSCPKGQSFSSQTTGRQRALSCSRGKSVVRLQLWERAADGGSFLSSESRIDDGGLETWAGYDPQGRRVMLSIEEQVDGGVVQTSQQFLENGAVTAMKRGPPTRGSPLALFDWLPEPDLQWWPDGCLAVSRDGNTTRYPRRSSCPPAAADAGEANSQPAVILDTATSQWSIVAFDGGAPLSLTHPSGTHLSLSPPKPGPLGVAWSLDGRSAVVAGLESDDRLTVVDLGKGTRRPIAPGEWVQALLPAGSTCPPEASWGRRLPDGSTLCGIGASVRRKRGDRSSTCELRRQRSLLTDHSRELGPQAFQLTWEEATRCAETLKGLVVPIPGLDPLGPAGR